MLQRVRGFFTKLVDEVTTFFDPDVRRAIRADKGPRGWFRSIIDVIWDAVCAVLYVIFRSIVSVVVASWDMTRRYCELVSSTIEKEQRWYIRIPMYAGYVFAPIAALFIPAGVVVVLATICVIVDQFTYPSFPVNEKFLAPQSAQLSLDRKSAMLFEAATYQMDKELHSLFGWTPNDVKFNPASLPRFFGIHEGIEWMSYEIPTPARFFDNRLNRQLGVRNATRKLVVAMSKHFTNYGSGDDENKYTHEAGAEFSSPPDYWNWYMGDSEDMYKSALEKVQRYMSDAHASNAQKNSNIKTDDLLRILWVIIDDVLREPLGKLQEKHKRLDFSELDDAVYYTQGSAIVARDVLVALRSTFHDVLVKGSDDNLNYAINALNEIIEANPWCVWRGDDHIMLLMDHRAKFALAYNLAIERLKDTAESLKI